MSSGKRRRQADEAEVADARAVGSPPPEAERRLPRWLAPALYGLLTLILFRKFVISGEMLFGSDTLGLGYVARAFYAEMLRSGTFPLWNPFILGGTPFLESLAGGDSLYPTSLLLLFLDTYRALGWKLVLHVFAGGLFMYGWVRRLGVTPLAASVAGIAYLSAPFLVSLVWPGHDGKIFITALTPLLFWLAERTLTRGGVGSYAALALGIGVVIISTHFQAAYFLFGALGLYYAFRCFQLWRAAGTTRALVAFGLFLGSAVAGAGVSAVQLLPAVDYVTEHSRRTQTTTQASREESLAYSSSWGLHPEEVAALVVPEFVGGNVGGAAWAENTYWGRNVFKHNHEYAGLVVLILASLAFVGGARSGVRWFLLFLGTLAILFGLGGHTPVWRILYELVPGISLFRAPSNAAFLFGFSAITLMALGLDRVLALRSRQDADWPRIRNVSVGWVAGLAVLTGLAASGVLLDVWVSVLYAGIDPAKATALEQATPFIVRGFAISTTLAGGVGGAIWLYRDRRIGAALLASIVGVLAFADVVRVDDPFIETFDFRTWSAPDPNIRYLQGRLDAEEPFRVFSMMGGNGQDVNPAMFGLELAGGHHPNDLGRYRELIGMAGSGLPQRLFESPNILPILNVRYLLWPVAQLGPLEAVQGVPHLEGLRRVNEAALADGRVYSAVYAFPGLPRARLVSEAVIVPDEDAVSFIAGPGFDPTGQVVLAEPAPIALDGQPPEGAVRWTRREPNGLELDVETTRPALLVLSESWFPSWRARVDGEPTALLRANYVLRAVPLEPGRHRVEIAYDTGSLVRALLLSLACTAVLVTFIVVSARRGRGGGRVPDAGGELPRSAAEEGELIRPAEG
jgi:hypothetical protein